MADKKLQLNVLYPLEGNVDSVLKPYAMQLPDNRAVIVFFAKDLSNHREPAKALAAATTGVIEKLPLEPGTEHGTCKFVA